MATEFQDIAPASGTDQQVPTPPPLPAWAEDVSGEKKTGADLKSETEGGKGAEPLHARKGLPIEVKRFCVESFACFQDVTTIQREVAKRFGLTLDARWIAKYDARRPNSQMGKGLRSLYAETRAAYIRDTAQVAISHQAHRLRLVGRIVEKATNSKDYAAALKGLELAAKEMGGALTSQHTVKHEGMIGHVHATVEEARAEVAARLRQVMDGGTLLPMATLPALPSAPSVDAPPTEEGPG